VDAGEGGRAIYGLIAARAARDPEAPALLAPGRPPLGYGRLLRQVDETARALHRRGIGRGDRVAVALPNGPEMATAFLAVGAAATCAPLNPAYTAEEFDFYLSDLRARALIVPAGVPSPAIAVARERGIAVVELASDTGGAAGVFALAGADDAAGAQAEQEGYAEAGDVALVLHTSGTTSRPKIVPLTHANLRASAGQIAASFGLGAADRCLNVMPLFHIHGLVGALLSSLAAGGSVVCAPGFDPAAFFPWLEEFRPTWYTAVPTMHQAVLAEAPAHRDAVARHSLRFIRSCSSALPPRVMAQLEAAFGVPAVESYGMTEAAHQMATNPLPPGARKPGSVGLAAGPEVAILDEAGNPLPDGQTGEVALRGASVTAGYEGNPEANAKAFANGWFRTGDQGYRDADGYLFLTSRLKEIINRGGEKIGPREVDEALLEHPAVAQAVTFALPHPSLGEVPAAAVTLRPSAAATGREIRAFAAGRLAAFKVPQRVLILDALPKGPTGKLQRIGLAERLGLVGADGAAPAEEPEEPDAVPAMPLEAQVAAMWAEVLEVGRVGLHDDFLDLGGDSLQATRVLARIHNALGREMSLAEFFEEPTVAALARRLAAEKTPV